MPADSTAPDWPFDDTAAWKCRATARLQARPDLLSGLFEDKFVPAVIDCALGFFCTSMAAAGGPLPADSTAAWICLNAHRSLYTGLRIANVLFNILAADGPTP